MQSILGSVCLIKFEREIERVLRKMKIGCSRQLFTKVTDRHCDSLCSWRSLSSLKSVCGPDWCCPGSGCTPPAGCSWRWGRWRTCAGSGDGDQRFGEGFCTASELLQTIDKNFSLFAPTLLLFTHLSNIASSSRTSRRRPPWTPGRCRWCSRCSRCSASCEPGPLGAVRLSPPWRWEIFLVSAVIFLYSVRKNIFHGVT